MIGNMNLTEQFYHPRILYYHHEGQCQFSDVISDLCVVYKRQPGHPAIEGQQY
jgi:hypothetical protein